MRCSIFSVALVGAVLCGITFSAEIPASLDAGWQNPPDEARLRAYWWWLNGNVTSNSITRDLEAMRAQGFGGALICDANGASQDGNAKVRLLKVYHGKVGQGLSVEMSVKHGPVTLLSVVETKEGKLKFSIGARKFVNDWNAHGPAHHCAVGVGRVADKIEKLGKLLQVEVARVC